jgi:predicted DsbA family dithiol-disulfide isomerase
VEWLPYDLHPEYPAEGIPRADLIARHGAGMTDRLSAFFAERGLPPSNPPVDIVPRTLTALRVGELARERGLHTTFHDRLMDAYWAESLDIGDPGVLRRLSEEAGLPVHAVDSVISSEIYLDVVHASTEKAISIGVTGVPGFLLDERLLVVGAHQNEVFEQAFSQLA